MLLWLVLCAEIMLALEDLYGDLSFYIRDHQNRDAFMLMCSLDFSRCAGRIGKIQRQHIKSMPAVLVLATCLKHADAVELVTYDLQ